jgi:hypothetical protein
MIHTAIENNEGSWMTAGFFDPDGEWIPLSQHGNREEALAYASYYNGGLHPDAVAATMAYNAARLQSPNRSRFPDLKPPKKTVLDRICTWHKKAVNASNVQTLDMIRRLAHQLVVEEFGEYTEALNDNHQTDADEVKELCDLIFVAIFRIMALGYDPISALDGVTTSNESKFFDSEYWIEDELAATISDYCRENQTSSIRPVSETQIGVFNVNTGKLRKGPFYEAPTMEGHQLTNYPFIHGSND